MTRYRLVVLVALLALTTVACGSTSSSLGTPLAQGQLTYAYFDGSILISWKASTTPNNAGYDVYITGAQTVYESYTTTDADGNSVVKYYTNSEGMPIEDTPTKDPGFSDGKTFNATTCVSTDTTWCRLTSSAVKATSYRVTGLVNGASYFFKVKEFIKGAKDSIDFSVPNPTDAVTLTSYPTFYYTTVPTGFSAATSTTATLAWNPMLDVGTDPTQTTYEVCQATTQTACSSSFTATYSTNGGVTSCLATGLSAATTYYFTICGKNGSSVSAVPLQMTVTTSTDTSTISLWWDGVDDDSQTYYPTYKILYYMDSADLAPHDDPYDYFSDSSVPAQSVAISPPSSGNIFVGPKQYLINLVVNGQVQPQPPYTIGTATFGYRLPVSGLCGATAASGAKCTVKAIVRSFDNFSSLLGTSRVLSFGVTIP